jgi:hypothetical protein
MILLPNPQKANQLGGYNQHSKSRPRTETIPLCGRPRALGFQATLVYGFNVNVCFLIAVSALSLNGAHTGFPSYQYGN